VTAGRQNGFLKRRIAAWAKNVGLRSNMAAMKGSVVNCDVSFVGPRPFRPLPVAVRPYADQCVRLPVFYRPSNHSHKCTVFDL